MHLISNHDDRFRKILAYTMYIQAECSKFLARLLDKAVYEIENIKPEQFRASGPCGDWLRSVFWTPDRGRHGAYDKIRAVGVTLRVGMLFRTAVSWLFV